MVGGVLMVRIYQRAGNVSYSIMRPFVHTSCNVLGIWLSVVDVSVNTLHCKPKGSFFKMIKSMPTTFAC